MIQDLRAIIIFYAGNGWIPCMLCSEDRWLSYLVGTISESAPNIVFLLQNNRLKGIVLVRSFKQGFASDQSRGSCAYYDNSHYQDGIQLDLSKVKGCVQGWVEVVLTVTRFRYAWTLRGPIITWPKNMSFVVNSYTSATDMKFSEQYCSCVQITKEKTWIHTELPAF